MYLNGRHLGKEEEDYADDIICELFNRFEIAAFNYSAPGIVNQWNDYNTTFMSVWRILLSSSWCANLRAFSNPDRNFARSSNFKF